MANPIDALIASINRKQKETVLVRGAELKHLTFQRATTGALAFDIALGGGWPLNCWNEVIGNESAGKTVMVLKTIAANQALNPEYHTLWVASEDFNMAWAEELGIDIDRVTFVMTNVMENAYDAVLSVLAERAVDAVVIDSFPALVPSDEEDRNMMELTVGRGAYITNKFMRKSLSASRRSLTEDDRPCLGLFINQWRDRIGAIGHSDPRITPGGKGKNYTFMTRVDVAREEWIANTTTKLKVGQAIKIRTVKNKTAPPQRTASVDFYFDDYRTHPVGSYDDLKQVWTIGTAADIIELSGSWYSFDGTKWQGEKAAIAALAADPLMVAAITAQIRHFMLKEPMPEPVEQPRKRRVARKAP